MWGKIDDGWARHDKVRRAGKEARELWAAAFAESNSRNADGVVSPLVLRDAAHYAEIDKPADAARRLVEVGLWHDRATLRRCKHECRDVAGKLEDGAYYFHDWIDYNKPRDVMRIPLERQRDARRNQLKRNQALCQQIHERDGDICRYCGKRVNFKARRGPDRGTFDHIDPNGDNELDNVCVACGRCNSDKGARLPAEAGMPDPRGEDGRIPPITKPRPGSDLVAARSEPDGDQDATQSDPVRPSRTRATPDAAGSGQAGTGPGPGRNLVPARSELGRDQNGDQDAKVVRLPPRGTPGGEPA